MAHIPPVEVNELGRALASRPLKRQGHAITIAVEGNQAVEMMAADRPCDLILLDMSLPALDGWGAASQIRECGSKVPVIALATQAMKGDAPMADAAACDDHEANPVELSRLIAKAEALLTT